MGVIGPLLVGLPIAMQAWQELNGAAAPPTQNLAGAGGALFAGAAGATIGGGIGLASKHRKWLSPLLAAAGGFGAASVGGPVGRNVSGLFQGEDPDLKRLRQVAELERVTAQRRLRDELELGNWASSQQATRNLASIIAQGAVLPRPPMDRPPSRIGAVAAQAMPYLLG